VAYKTKYKPQNISKYIGDPTKIVCRSLWERRVCRYLDENKNVLQWGSEELRIPYYSPTDKRIRGYFPDFIVEMLKKDGSAMTYILEIKPKKQTKPPPPKNKKNKSYIQEQITFSINEAKWNAAKNFCREKGWRFLILTEDDILP